MCWFLLSKGKYCLRFLLERCNLELTFEVAVVDTFRARIVVTMETVNSSGSGRTPEGARFHVISVHTPVKYATVVCVTYEVRRLCGGTS